MGSVTPASPARIELVFSERVSLGSHPLRLAASGRPVPLRKASLRDGGRIVSAPLSQRDERVRGVLVLRWSAISDDGDPISGEYQFAIGAGQPGALRGPTTVETLPSPSRIVAQWLTIAGISLAILGAWLVS